MANISNTATANQVAFGQLGAVYTTSSSDAIKPPIGMVFVAITMLSDTQFTTSGLLAEVNTKHFNTSVAAGDLDSGSETAQEGSGGKRITSTVTFPKGITVYGRWTEIKVNSGSVIAYIG